MIRSIKNSLFIAQQYLCFHWLKSFILVGSLSIIIFVPFFLEVVVRESQNQLTSRGETTPLLLGAKGSTLDLTVNSLYFFGKQPEEINMLQAHEVERTGLAKVIPLYTRFKAEKNPIIGTTVDYFNLRQLQMAEGNLPSILGEVVLGASVARKQGLSVGDSIMSSPENLFDLAGVYPLQMTVAGILIATGTADDEAVFVDIKTSWIIAGLGHGHDDLAHPEGTNAVTSSAKMHNTITKDNIDQFHFHGEEDNHPITAAIVVPHDQKSKAILLGRYQADQGNLQLIQPEHVIDGLVQSIFRIKNVMETIVFVIMLSTILTLILVYMLSVQLRKKEIETIYRLGCSRMAIAGFIGSEIAILFLLSSILSAFYFLWFREFSDTIIISLLNIY